MARQPIIVTPVWVDVDGNKLVQPQFHIIWPKERLASSTLLKKILRFVEAVETMTEEEFEAKPPKAKYLPLHAPNTCLPLN